MHLSGSPSTPPPGIYRIKDKSMREEQVQLRCGGSHAFITDCSARAASRRCPILRAGSKIVSILKPVLETIDWQEL